MPKQGQSVESCIVSEFKKKVGDTVKVGDVLFDKLKLDPKANQVRGELKVISAKGSKIPVVIIPTNEELMIARDTVKVLGA